MSNPSVCLAVKRQDGLILFVVMVFLILFGAAAIQAFQSSNIAEKIAGNQWEQDRAYQAAEAGLTDGKNWLFAFVPSADEYYDGACPAEGVQNIDIWNGIDCGRGDLSSHTADWSGARAYGSDTNATDIFDNNVSAPAYYTEYIGWYRDNLSPEDTSAGLVTYYYSVSALGVGQSAEESSGVTVAASRSVLQSVISKRYR